MIPGQGFSKVFSKTVGPHGQVDMVWPDEYANSAHPDTKVDRGLAQQPQYSHMTMLAYQAAKFSMPEIVDVVFASQNYQDPDRAMGSVDPTASNCAVFWALKPGGFFLIVDHVAEAGSGMRETDTLHRIGSAVVAAQVTSAGFRFDGGSQALRNSADDHRRRVFDTIVRGHTDRFISGSASRVDHPQCPPVLARDPFVRKMLILTRVACALAATGQASAAPTSA